MRPNNFEVVEENVPETEIYSLSFRSFCAAAEDSVKYYSLMTVEEDWQRCSPGKEKDPHTEYECSRLRHLAEKLEKSKDYLGPSAVEKEVTALAYLEVRLSNLMEGIKQSLSFLTDDVDCGLHTKTDCFSVMETKCDTLLDAVKPRWCDITDAGPGVGVSNFEVRLRDAEMAILHNTNTQ